MGTPLASATLLVRDGRIGDLVGVTHLHDKPLPPLVGTPFDAVPHMLLTDYLLHWVDITRTWLADGGAGRVKSVQAADSRVPGQPDDARNPWAATLSMTAATGATAFCGSPATWSRPPPAVRSGCTAPTGTLRGSVLLDSDRLEIDDGQDLTSVPLRGAWFVDGFAAALGELMCAVAEHRQPENSAADAAESVRLVLAARESAERGGTPWRSGVSEDVDALVDEVRVDPATARVYAEGWQSWSPATWHAATRPAGPGGGLGAPDAVPAGDAGHGRGPAGGGPGRRRPRYRGACALLRHDRPGRGADHPDDGGRRPGAGAQHAAPSTSRSTRTARAR